MQLYQVGKLIGIGSFGQVFLCKHKDQDKYYVVKKLKMMEKDQKERQNIENQLKLLQKLRHPNIVSFKDSFTDKDGNLCIVMAYCQGGDMHSKIRSTKQKGKNFSQSQILDWITHTILAVHYLHNQQILHRDLKCQNLFLKKDDKVRLGDFGIAKVLDNAQDLTTTFIGTPYYMAPQIFKYKSYSYKCDIWSLGVIFYEMCNLRFPFQAQNYQALAVKIMKGSYPSITPTYSKQLRDLIISMLSPKPQNRPTIVDVINKPFIRKRVEKYMNDMFNRNSNNILDNDDIYLDTLREQATSLQIYPINPNSNPNSNPNPNAPITQQDLLKKYPSSKDLQRRWTRVLPSRRGDQQDPQPKKQYHQKKKSLIQRDAFSLQKNIKKKQDTNSSSTKVLKLDYDFKDQKQAFVDHKKKSMLQRQTITKTIEDRRNNFHDQVMKNHQNHQKIIQQENMRRFRMQEDYSMLEQPNDSDQNSINQQIIQQQSDEDLHELTTTFNFQQDQQAPQNYNKTYYKILDQIRVLKHACQTGIGASKYLKAYKAVNNGCNKSTILEILGNQQIGYWHLLDQIMFNDNILKTLSKQ